MKKVREYFYITLLEPCKRRLGARGAEMIEYALVLACVVAVCAVVYTVNQGTSGADFKINLIHLWEKISYSIKNAI